MCEYACASADTNIAPQDDWPGSINVAEGKNPALCTGGKGGRGAGPVYEFLDNNPSMHSAPVQIGNDPRHISKNDMVMSVNATLQVDLSGACNSEHVLGRQFSGSGGQLDFVQGASASQGGKSMIACRSTAKDGTISRIVSKLEGPVTTPRNDTHIVVTEYGPIDLRGKSLSQRADALISIAHPKFRSGLASEALA